MATLGEKAVRRAPPPPSRPDTVETTNSSAKNRPLVRAADPQAAGKQLKNVI